MNSLMSKMISDNESSTPIDLITKTIVKDEDKFAKGIETSDWLIRLNHDLYSEGMIKHKLWL